jgi:hypothetical protein
MKYKNILVFVLMPLLLAGLLASCSGDGGNDAPPLSPPAFTNLAGTRWNHTDTVSDTNDCGTGIGVTDSFVLHILSQSGNTLSFYDERNGASSAVNGTMSGSVVTYSGTRYPVQGCSDMTVNYSMTVNAAGTIYSGTGTITCLDDPCSLPVSVSGTKIP